MRLPYYADVYAIYVSDLGYCIYVEAETVSKDETYISVEQIVVSGWDKAQIAT